MITLVKRLRVNTLLNLSIIIFLGIFISCSPVAEDEMLTKEDVCPQWVPGFPQVINGTTSMDITVELNKAGKVYYVISTSEITNSTARFIQTQAQTQKTGAVVKNGIIDIAKNNQPFTEIISGLASDKKYFVYMVGGVDSVIMNDSQVIKLEKQFPKRQKEVQLGTSTAAYGYYEYLPDAYYKNTSEKFPLVVFLHGSGEKGNGTTNLDLILKHGPPKLIHAGKDFPFICISPQSSVSWNAATLNTFIDFIKTTYRIDEKRIYMTGLSMGAIGTFSYAINFPDKLAAAVPVAGNANPVNACKIKDLPLWAFHNEGDEVVASSGSKNFVNALKECGSSPLLTIYPVNGHDAWSAAYNDQNMWAWFIAQAKK